MILPIKIGERVVVNGIMYAKAYVSNVDWIEEESRWVITLNWGEHGTSRVYDYDEGKTWYRWSNKS